MMINKRNMIGFRFHISIVIAVIILSMSMAEDTKSEKSNCECSEDIATLSRDIKNLKDEMLSHTEQLEIWAMNRDFVIRLKDTLDAEIGEIVKREMAKYASEGTSLPNSECTVGTAKDDKWDAVRQTETLLGKKDERTLKAERAISNEQNDRRLLQEKLKETQEKIEHRTMHVVQDIRDEYTDLILLQENMKQTEIWLENIVKLTGNEEQQILDELRDRRLLQQEVKETQSSLGKVEDRETEIKGHLQKFYNKVGCLAQKNETKKLNERVVHAETQINEGCKSSHFLKLTEDMKKVEDKLQKINISIVQDILPRMAVLVSETVRRDAVELLEDKVTYILYKTEQFKRQVSDEWAEFRDIRTPDIHTANCDIPVSKESHLLMDIERKSDGTERLTFGCRPIGQYVLNDPTIRVTCENGSWSGRYPLCRSLLDPNTAKLFSEVLIKKYPCITNEEIFPDPSNCSRYFTCSHGKAVLKNCPYGSFDKYFKSCSLYATCDKNNDELIPDLQDFIPPITIQPNKVDDYHAFLGTGPAGQLVVYPRSNFTLHCFYPQHMGGSPIWDISYSKAEEVTRSIIPYVGKNKVSLSIIRAKKGDTGIYRCTTPFGKSHEIYVLVKAVECPPITLSDEYEVIYYTTSYGKLRQMNSRAYFPCMTKSEYAVCMANGKWSKYVPECTLKKRRSHF